MDIQSLPPSKRNKLLQAIPNPGTCCIATVVSGDYQWYIPLFIDRAVKAYPEYQIRIYTRGQIDPWFFTKYKEILVHDVFQEYPQDGFTTAALRFVFCDDEIKKFDYVLITDIDIMLMRETPSLVDQHMLDLRSNGLECYSNYATNHDKGGMPGVHFVTKDWWKRTEEARNEYDSHLKQFGSEGFWYDEWMIHQIVVESGLPVQDKRTNLWCHHGVHLGDYRRRIENRMGGNNIPPADQQKCILDMLEDPVFMNTAYSCGNRYPIINSIFNELRNIGK